MQEKIQDTSTEMQNQPTTNERNYDGGNKTKTKTNTRKNIKFENCFYLYNL